MRGSIPGVLQFEDLQSISGYSRAADVERWAKENGIPFKRSRNGAWTTMSALDQAFGVRAANADSYSPDEVI